MVLQEMREGTLSFSAASEPLQCPSPSPKGSIEDRQLCSAMQSFGTAVFVEAGASSPYVQTPYMHVTAIALRSPVTLT